MMNEGKSFLHLRTVTKAEKKAWNDAKDRRGLDLETWVRESLNEEARRTGIVVQNEDASQKE